MVGHEAGNKGPALPAVILVVFAVVGCNVTSPDNSRRDTRPVTNASPPPSPSSSNVGSPRSPAGAPAAPSAAQSPAADNSIAPELLRHLLPELNYSLEKKNPLRRAALERGTVTIEFNLATPSASDTIRGLREVGAKDDTRDILAWARNVRLDFDTLIIKGWYGVPDNSGKVTDTVVLEARYRRSVVDEINFASISLDSVWARAFKLYTHPILKS